jgi:hypothetical protein
MSMYLPNPDVHPTGYEPAEFIEPPRRAERIAPVEAAAPFARAAAPLDLQTRLNITRWAEEYIAGLVANHHGGGEDVRSVIHRLHDQAAIAEQHGSV